MSEIIWLELNIFRKLWDGRESGETHHLQRDDIRAIQRAIEIARNTTKWNLIAHTTDGIVTLAQSTPTPPTAPVES